MGFDVWTVRSRWRQQTGTNNCWCVWRNIAITFKNPGGDGAPRNVLRNQKPSSLRIASLSLNGMNLFRPDPVRFRTQAFHNRTTSPDSYRANSLYLKHHRRG